MNSGTRILIAGRLGKNPELKYTREQTPVCYLAVAETNSNEDKPIWHKVVVWGKEAELCSLYLKKGSFVFVQGQNKLINFTNKDGEHRKYFEVKAEKLGFTQL